MLGNKGNDQVYNIEAIDKDILLIRNTADSQLQLINRANGKGVVLFKQLLPAQQQEYVQLSSTGPMGDSDRISYAKRVGHTLYFDIDFPDLDTKTATYNLDELN